jgi:hypothetical protein
MRKYLWLLLVVPGLALGQGIKPPGGTGGVIGPVGSGGGKVIASFPLSSTGGLIAEDANTVAHVYWDGSALVDTKGNSWTMNGTVPQVTANPFTTTRYGAGPFSDTNYYSLAAGHPLNFAGDNTVCVVYAPTVNSGYVFDHDCTAVGNGAYCATLQTSGAVASYPFKGSAPGYLSLATPAGSTAVGGPSVVCVGRSGNNAYLKANLTTTQTGVTVAGASSAKAFYLGRSISNALSFTGTIYELYATATPWSEATVTAIQQRVLGHFDGTSPLSVTRASNATYGNPAGTVWTAAPGVARITTDGLLVEPAATSYIQNSDAPSTGTAASAGWTLSNATVATVAGAPIGTWAEVSGANAGAQIYSASTVPLSTGVVGCAWAAKASGSGNATVGISVGGGTWSACTCSRSDGAACTATNSTTQCRYDFTGLTTTPVRVCLMGTTAATTLLYLFLGPGAWGNATASTTRFAAGYLTVSATGPAYPTSHISVAGTSVQRNADAVSATVPAVPSKWCVAVTAKAPFRSWRQTGTNYLLGTGIYGETNAWFLSDMYLQVFDGATVQKYIGDYAEPSTASHRVVACDASGAMSLTIDGGLLSLAGGGAGTGIMTSPVTTLYFGHNALGANQSMTFKNLKICSAKSAKECK